MSTSSSISSRDEAALNSFFGSSFVMSTSAAVNPSSTFTPLLELELAEFLQQTHELLAITIRQLASFLW